MTPQNVPISGNVLDNDSNPAPGTTLQVTSFEIAGVSYAAGSVAVLPGVGTLVINADGQYTFTPAPNYSGPVPVVTYTIDNGQGSVSSTLTLTVTPVETGLPPDFNESEAIATWLRHAPWVFLPGDRVDQVIRVEIPFSPAIFGTAAVETSQLERIVSDSRGIGTEPASPYETRLSSQTADLGFDPTTFVQKAVRQTQAEARFFDVRVSGRQGVIKLNSDERLPSPSLFQAPPLGKAIDELRDESKDRDPRSTRDQSGAAGSEPTANAGVLPAMPPSPVAQPGRAVTSSRAFSEQLREASARLRPLADSRSLQAKSGARA